MKVSTLCFLVKGDRILLAMKKRGFGEGKWNGVGGKVNEGESVGHAALREMDQAITTTTARLRPLRRETTPAWLLANNLIDGVVKSPSER